MRSLAGIPKEYRLVQPKLPRAAHYSACKQEQWSTPCLAPVHACNSSSRCTTRKPQRSKLDKTHGNGGLKSHQATDNRDVGFRALPSPRVLYMQMHAEDHAEDQAVIPEPSKNESPISKNNRKHTRGKSLSVNESREQWKTRASQI